MKRVTFTIAYIFLIAIAAHINRAQGKPIESITQLSNNSSDYSEEKQKASLSTILASGPVRAFPEPATLSLFGFGFLMVIGFGWIKKTPDKI